VVDDNKDVANSLAMLLRLKGNDIRTAHDGVEALAVADIFHPEIVLLDIGLPKLNGYDVARRIRQQPWGQDVLLIALTGWGNDEDRRLSQEAGFNFHIVKPVDLAALEELLAKV
jgi:CheY-like chemotaxis protein